MKKWIATLLRKMSKNIKSFWGVQQTFSDEQPAYKDYPISPFGPTRLFSVDTIVKLLK